TRFLDVAEQMNVALENVGARVAPLAFPQNR
ncbi:MAG: hypothetical protein RI949_1525, partial [Pseudomonadota bacterium]